MAVLTLKIFARQLIFLLLMAGLGVLAVGMLQAGYPLAWDANGQHFLLVNLAVSLLIVFLVLGAVFYVFRNFLFKRGRPWLAIFSTVCWLLVIGAFVMHRAADRNVLIFGPIAAGNKAMSDRISEIYGMVWSDQEVQGLPEESRSEACLKVFDSQIGATYKTTRSGIPVTAGLPSTGDDRARFFGGQACSTRFKEAFSEVIKLERQLKDVMDTESDMVSPSDSDQFAALIRQQKVIRGILAQTAMLMHPDAAVAMAKIAKDRDSDPIGSKIRFSQLELRIYQNGQVKDHTWQPTERLASASENESHFLDPIVWEGGEEGVRYFWARTERNDGDYENILFASNCKNFSKWNIVARIVRESGQLKFRPEIDPFGFSDKPAQEGSNFFELNRWSCGKGVQVAKLPEEFADNSVK